MDSEGGIFFIDVDDYGNVIGLENDYHLIKKINSDRVEQELRQSIDKYLKNKIANEYIKLTFIKKMKKNFMKLI
jgi:hypothetical protein